MSITHVQCQTHLYIHRFNAEGVTIEDISEHNTDMKNTTWFQTDSTLQVISQ